MIALLMKFHTFKKRHNWQKALYQIFKINREDILLFFFSFIIIIIEIKSTQFLNK